MYSAIVEHYAMNRLKSQDDCVLSLRPSPLFFDEFLFELIERLCMSPF